MYKICLIGNSGNKSGACNGQVEKVRLYRKLLIEEGFCVNFVELEGFMHHPLKTLSNIRKSIIKSDRIILITAQRGCKILIPYINNLNKKLNKPFILPMIGINILHKYVDGLDIKSFENFILRNNFGNVDPSKKDIVNLSKITYILPENEILTKTIKCFFHLDNVFSLTNFRNVEIKIGREKRKFNNRFCFVSRVSRQKGIFMLLEAMDKINDPEVFVDIYGPLQLDRDELVFFYKCLNGNTKYCGTIPNEEVLEKINNYDALIFPTLYAGEGTPGIISEALIAGVPVISTNFLYANLLLKDRYNSLILEQNNSENLIKSLLLFKNDSHLRCSLTNGAIASGGEYKYSFNREYFLHIVCGK